MKHTIQSSVLLALAAMLCLAASPVFGSAAWTSPNSYRLMLTVDGRGVVRSHSPASVDINLQQALINQGSTGVLDEDTIEVMAYDASGQPAVFDSTRVGYERYLLPWRVEKRYMSNVMTLSFVMPDETYTGYAVYFDTKDSGLGKPERYKGIVGDGDKFREGYKRREIAPNWYDAVADLDGDGDLDLFTAGTEPFVYCYENVGGNRFVERGKLTSGGEILTFPYEKYNNRSWMSIEFHDWNNNGKQDLFVHFLSNTTSQNENYGQNTVLYENTTPPGGQLTFVDRGMIKTVTGKNINSRITIVDWDGDGKKDVISSEQGVVTFHKNIGTDSSPALADGVYIYANGTPIRMWDLRIECADIDNDGDLDLFVGMCDGKIFWFENVGTRTDPVFTEGRLIVFHEGGYSDLRPGMKIADWDGDGLLDILVGRYWQRAKWGDDPRLYGRLYKNVGTLTEPKFEGVDAYNGAPYTEQFQECDALRQNGVRAVDWDNDGRTDLIASDTDGFVWLFRNLTNQLFPVFAAGERLRAGDGYVKVQGEAERRIRDGYARVDIADWNNDGKKDLIVADGGGWVWLYLNVGTDSAPVLAEGTRIYANGKPIDGTARSSVLICDWDNDGRKDLIHAVTGQNTVSEYWDWPWQGTDPSDDSGFLFYKNIGTDADPVLAYPEWIRGGGQIITYNSRPNLGSYVDWDGDGKKDFITGEFESSARFYKNIGSGLPGEKPVFADTVGVGIVRPWTVQMMSGADAINWNGDSHPLRPEYDIVTGQGHGGTGLRFYERDYIEDYVNNMFPIVSVGTTSQAHSIRQSKSLADGSSVMVPGGIVSAAFADCFYIQSEERVSGIRVQMSSHGVSPGMKVDVTGVMATNSHGERYIAPGGQLVPNGSGNAHALALSAKALGGADLAFNPGATVGQRGITDGVGLNNIGLLVKVFGRCTLNLALSGPDYFGKSYIFVDDGSGTMSWYRSADGSFKQIEGVKIEVVDASISEGEFVVVTGVSSIELVNGIYQSRVLPVSW